MLGLVAFAVVGIAMVVVQGAFYRALACRDPAAYISDDEVLQRFAEPSKFVSFMSQAAMSRLRALLRSSPYPEVERLRRYALVLQAATLVVFAANAVGVFRN